MSRKKWFLSCCSIGLLSMGIVLPQFVHADSKVTTGEGTIRYVDNDEETIPIDPENPDEPIDVPKNEFSKTSGPLRLDFIPMLHFGSQAISDKDQTYEVNAQLFSDDREARPNDVQVTDHRGTLSGWELTVRQETPFENKDTENSELKGVILSFDNQWASSKMDKAYAPTIMKDAIKIEQIGASYPVAKAEPGKGSGTWAITFGSTGEVEGIEKTLTPLLNADGSPVTNPTFNNHAVYKNSAIKLFVPGKTQKDPVKYKAVLTWTLSELT